MTPAEKAKQAYQTGGSGGRELLGRSQPRVVKKAESWPIHSADGDLVGFVELEPGAELPTELVIQDRVYQIRPGHIGRIETNKLTKQP